MTQHTPRVRPRGRAPHWRLPAVLLALLPFLTIAAACDDSGSESSAAAADASSASGTTVDPEFRARAEAVCDPYAAYQRETILDLPHFNRYVPDPALLPQVAEHLAKNPAYQTLVADLEALGDPASGAAAWAAVLDDFHATADVVHQEIEVAEKGDAEQFPDLVNELEQDMTTLFTDLSTAGLSGSSCAQAEGDPLKAHVNAG